VSERVPGRASCFLSIRRFGEKKKKAKKKGFTSRESKRKYLSPPLITPRHSPEHQKLRFRREEI